VITILNASKVLKGSISCKGIAAGEIIRPHPAFTAQLTDRVAELNALAKRVKNKMCFILCQDPDKAFEDKMNCQFQRIS
jgi:hypothetical protein